MTVEKFSKRIPKIDIHDQVNDRIQRRVRITEPNKGVHNKVRYKAGVIKQWSNYIYWEKGQPTGYETAHNDRQGFCDSGLGAGDLMLSMWDQTLYDASFWFGIRNGLFC